MLELNPKISTIQPLVDYLNRHRANEKFNQALEISATLALITFFLLFAIRPTIITISALVGEIKSKELLTKEMRSKINQVVEAQDKFSQVQQRYLVIESSLPDSPRFAHIVGQISQSSSGVGSSLSIINFAFPETTQNGSAKTDPLFSAPSLKKYGLSTAVSADYPVIVNFLKSLLDNRRLVSVKNITVKNSDKAKSNPEAAGITVNLSTDIFYWHQK